MMNCLPIALAGPAALLGALSRGPEPAGATAAPAGRDTMASATSEFRAGHAALIFDFGYLMSGAVGPVSTHRDRAHLVLYLRAGILSHARAEEKVLYPALDSILGTKGYATATMVLDHRAIARLVDDLSALASSPYPEAYRRKAYALGAVLESHFAKEEEFILPLLRQRMAENDLRALFARMEALPWSREWP